MRLTHAAAIVAILSAAIPAGAAAQDHIAGVSIATHATFNSVGITVSVVGDDDRDAQALLFIGVDGGTPTPAHRLSRTSDDRFVGSAISLPDGADYAVTVTLEDPDGVTDGTLSAAGTTRESEVPAPTGSAIHVSPLGGDGGDGSAGSPFGTIAAGVQAAGPGDEVVIHAGTYREEVTLTSGGTPSAPLVIRSAGDGEVVMSGASEALADTWSWTDEGGGIYSAPVDGTWYVAVDDTRLWRYESLSDLQDLTEETEGGFYFDGSLVHVRLPVDESPIGHEIEVSVLGRALWLEGAADVVVRGITFRCYGGEEYSEGIMVRDGSHRVWIVESGFEHVMPGIWVKNDVDDLVVMGNEFSDRGLAEFPWLAVKAQGGMESGALAVDGAYDGQGIVFAGNVVHDSFDGLNICGQAAMDHPNNADVSGNTFLHLADDGIEVDGDCSNIRVTLNRFEDSLVGVSTAPAAVGPVFVVRNLMVDMKNVAWDSEWMTRALKLNVDDPRPSGEIFVYHNTASTFEDGQPAFGVTDDSDWVRVVLANNIWLGTGPAFYYVNAGDEPFLQDYDLLHSLAGQLAYFQGSHYDSIEDYHEATGLCGACLSGDPLLADPGGGDYEPAPPSPAVDRGVPIPGINDSFTGNGPDIGAHELGGIGPDADVDVDSDADSDADSDSDSDADGEGLTIGDGMDPPDHASCACSPAAGASPAAIPLMPSLRLLL